MTEDQLDLWAWVTEMPDGRIVLVGVGLSLAEQLPLITHNKERALNLRSLAEAHGRATHQPVWLRRYTMAEEIGRIAATLNTKRQQH